MALCTPSGACQRRRRFIVGCSLLEQMELADPDFICKTSIALKVVVDW